MHYKQTYTESKTTCAYLCQPHKNNLVCDEQNWTNSAPHFSGNNSTQPTRIAILHKIFEILYVLPQSLKVVVGVFLYRSYLLPSYLWWW